MRRKIVRNVAQCKLCGQTIESTHRHHFVTCRCGNLSVDGGHDYLRRGFEDRLAWIELSEYEEEEIKTGIYRIGMKPGYDVMVKADSLEDALLKVGIGVDGYYRFAEELTGESIEEMSLSELIVCARCLPDKYREKAEYYIDVYKGELTDAANYYVLEAIKEMNRDENNSLK